MSVAAPAVVASNAYATPVTLGVCAGEQGLVHYSQPGTIGFTGLTDQTQTGVRTRLGLLRDDNNVVLSGGCSGSVRPGDPIHPAGGDVGPLTPSAMTASLLGNSSCAIDADARAADANAAAGWLASGSMTWTMQQLDDRGLHYKITAVVTISVPDSDTGSPDTVNVTGIVRSGVNFGATVSGTLWMDPVTRVSQFVNGSRASNYTLDLDDLTNCADPQASNATIPYMMYGGGDGTPFLQPDTSTSLLGSTASGITFTMG